MAKKHRIHLSAEDRAQLQGIVKGGKAAASKRQRAQILLAADASRDGGELRDVDIATIERIRRALCEQVCRLRCMAGRRTARHRAPSSTAGPRRIWWPAPAARRYKERHAGP